MTLGIKNKFIFYYGSISNRRHLPEAMLAFEKVAKKLLNYQFLIIGKNITSPFINIDNLAYNINKKLNKKAILRKDFVSDEKLALLYNSAELLIWLSEYEGFGLPVLEAISNGVPVITSPITSIPEVAGDAALYVQDPNDINNISENIYKILTNNKLREKLIKKSLEQAKKFSWQICAKSTLTILRR